MGTFFNGAQCDIYIGKGAGKMLLGDIRNAKESIAIISPYLSPFLIKELIEMKQRNIDIRLITTDTIEDFYSKGEKNIHKLILQHKHLDKDAMLLRNTWIDKVQILYYVLIGLLVFLATLYYFFRDTKIVLGLIPLAVFYFVRRLYVSKIENKRIFSYSYSQLFPFKVFLSPDKTQSTNYAAATFIHSKIYLIDSKIAYMGSLNFTESGIQNNYETRIKTVDIQAVLKVKEAFNELFYDTSLPERNIQAWGKMLYPEPIN